MKASLNVYIVHTLLQIYGFMKSYSVRFILSSSLGVFVHNELSQKHYITMCKYIPCPLSSPHSLNTAAWHRSCYNEQDIFTHTCTCTIERFEQSHQVTSFKAGSQLWSCENLHVHVYIMCYSHTVPMSVTCPRSPSDSIPCGPAVLWRVGHTPRTPKEVADQQMLVQLLVITEHGQ